MAWPEEGNDGEEETVTVEKEQTAPLMMVVIVSVAGLGVLLFFLKQKMNKNM